MGVNKNNDDGAAEDEDDGNKCNEFQPFSFPFYETRKKGGGEVTGRRESGWEMKRHKALNQFY